MPRPRRHLADGRSAARALAALRDELDVPASFPAAVEVAAAAAVASPSGPAAGAERAIRTDLPLVAIDPPGARDLDQALHIERRRGASGFVLWYAIADLAHFVAPGDPIDAEAQRRGVTLYLPDGNAPLHPPALSEGAASLLPGQDRPALLWRFALDAEGDLRDAEVRRSVVRVREAIDYGEAQRRIDSAVDPGSALALLARLGPARLEREAQRGGVSLQLAEQDVVAAGPEGGYELRYRESLPVEQWNAQLSLLTGMTAGAWMAEAGVGLVRTLPPPFRGLVDQLRRSAEALGVPFEGTYAAAVRALDPAEPRHAALAQQAARGLRGAGYTVVGPGVAPKAMRHAAVAAVYAHVTAPLRRLADRFANEVAVSLCHGAPVPEWTLAALAGLPEVMAETGRRASAVEAAVVDMVEALVLAAQVGETFPAIVVDARKGRSQVQLLDPPVVAALAAPLPLGERVTIRLDAVDVARRTVTFAPATS
jgi:exoribonuclease R